jgi:hypothetical protein
MPQRDPAAHLVVEDAELRKRGTNRRVEVHLPLLHQAHHRRRGHRFGDGADGEERVVRNRLGIVETRHPKTTESRLPVREHPETDPGYAVVRHLLGHEGTDRVETCVDRTGRLRPDAHGRNGGRQQRQAQELSTMHRGILQWAQRTVSSNFPCVLRASMSRCACAASARGYVPVRRTASAPRTTRSKTSPARHRTSSGGWM